jgi:hypothetical protein
MGLASGRAPESLEQKARSFGTVQEDTAASGHNRRIQKPRKKNPEIL